MSSSVGDVCVCLMGVPVDRSVRLTLFLACGCSFASHYFLLLSVVWGTMMTCLREVLLIWWVSSFFIGVVRSSGYLNAFFLRFTLFLQVPPSGNRRATPPHYYYTNRKPLMWTFIWYPGYDLGPILEPKPSLSHRDPHVAASYSFCRPPQIN